MSKNRLLVIRAHWFYVLFLLLLVGGCSQNQMTEPMPSITISPNSVSFPTTSQGTSSNPIEVTVTNSGDANLNISSVVIGGSNVSDFTTTNSCSGTVRAEGTCTITVTFVPLASGQRTETITLTGNAPNSPQIINVSGNANPITIALTPLKTAIATGQTTPFSATGDPAGVAWSVAGFTSSAPGVAAPAGTIDAFGKYTAPSGSQSLFVMVTATSKTDPTKSATATVNVVAPGVLAETNNVQVAQYAISPGASANVSVQFGLDTTYGFTTWTQPTGPFGGSVSLYVAGMKQSSIYHMRGVVQFADGTQFNDADQTFTTGTLPTAKLPSLTVTTTPGMTPQSGVEFLNLIGAGKFNLDRHRSSWESSMDLRSWKHGPAGIHSWTLQAPAQRAYSSQFCSLQRRRTWAEFRPPGD